MKVGSCPALGPHLDPHRQGGLQVVIALSSTVFQVWPKSHKVCVADRVKSRKFHLLSEEELARLAGLRETAAVLERLKSEVRREFTSKLPSEIAHQLVELILSPQAGSGQPGLMPANCAAPPPAWRKGMFQQRGSMVLRCPGSC